MTIKLRLAPRATLKARVAPRLGASVAAGDGMLVTLAGNVYTVAVDIPGLGLDSFQPLDPDLTAIANLTTAANKFQYWTGSHTAVLADLTAFARTLLDDADVKAANTTLKSFAISAAAFGTFGVGNDSTVMQAAIDYGIANCIPIFVPSGFYNVGNLTINGELTLFGAGRGDSGGTRFVTSGATTVFTVTTTFQVHLSGFKIVYEGGGATGVGIKVTNSTAAHNLGTVIRNIEITTPGTGIHIERCYKFTIDDVYFNVAVNGQNLLIENTHVTDDGDSSVTNCTFTQAAGGVGIKQIGSGGLRVINNKFIGGTTGYHCHLAGTFFSSIIIVGNSIELTDTPATAIKFTKAAGTGTETITNVVVACNQSIGTAYFVDVAADPDVGSRKWLVGLLCVANEWYGYYPSNAAVFFRVDGLQHFLCLGNNLRPNSASSFTRATIGAGCDNGLVGLNRGPSTFAADTVHGSATNINVTLDVIPSGAVVGTTDAQTLTNKTITSAGNTLTIGGKYASFSAHKNGTDQTGIASATPTQVTFGTEVFDVGGFFASNAWTPPAGKVMITATAVCTTGLTASTNATLDIYKNGSLFKRFGKLAGATNEVLYMSASIIDDANGTDAYTVVFTGTSAGTLTIAGGASVTYFMGTMLQ